MNGGSIEGFLKTDDQLIQTNTTQAAVYRTLGSGVTFTLAGNSFLGQNINQGLNGLDNGVTQNIFSPFGGTASGAILQLNGVISSSGAGATAIQLLSDISRAFAADDLAAANRAVLRLKYLRKFLEEARLRRAALES